MSNNEQFNHLSYIEKQVLLCKSPANVNYLRSAYIYAMGCGLLDGAYKKAIEDNLEILRLEKKEISQDHFNAIMRAIANYSVYRDLKFESDYFNHIPVDEAIRTISNELRSKRLKRLKNTYVNFFPKREGQFPHQHEEWLDFQISWYENELSYFNELRKLPELDADSSTERKETIRLAFKDEKLEKAITSIYNALHDNLIKADEEEFKSLFTQKDEIDLKKVEWLGSQAEIKAFLDLLKNNKLIYNTNLNQLAERCFFSTRHNIVARTLGAVTSQNAYLILIKEQDDSHVFYDLFKELKGLK